MLFSDCYVKFNFLLVCDVSYRLEDSTSLFSKIKLSNILSVREYNRIYSRQNKVAANTLRMHGFQYAMFMGMQADLYYICFLTQV